MYVGGSRNPLRRWATHRSLLRRGKHSNLFLQAAWNAHDAEVMRFSVLLVCHADDLLFYEQLVLDGLNPSYNRHIRADSPLGVTRLHPISKEKRAKLAAQRGWKHSEEAKAKMRGRVVSAETRALLSEEKRGNQNRLGQPVTDDVRQRISAKLKGRKRSPEAIAKHRATVEARRRSL
jgi:group I intron endonuclease